MTEDIWRITEAGRFTHGDLLVRPGQELASPIQDACSCIGRVRDPRTEGTLALQGAYIGPCKGLANIAAAGWRRLPFADAEIHK